jgi:acylphosphatase
LIKRAKITAFGKKIQKAGYRERVIEIADQLDIVGTVWNAPDGSVEIVCEGEEERINEFIIKVKIQEKQTDSPLPAIWVDDIKPVWEKKPTGEFKIFDVFYNGQMEIMRDLKSDVWEAKKIMNKMADYQKNTYEGVDNLTSSTDRNFINMEVKYHRISVLSFALLATISSFAVYGSLVYVDAIPKTFSWLVPWLGFNIMVWTATGYLTFRKNAAQTTPKNKTE